MTDERFPKYILPQTFNSNFGPGLMYKDVQMGIELAMQQDVPIFLAEVTRQFTPTPSPSLRVWGRRRTPASS